MRCHKRDRSSSSSLCCFVILYDRCPKFKHDVHLCIQSATFWVALCGKQRYSRLLLLSVPIQLYLIFGDFVSWISTTITVNSLLKIKLYNTVSALNQEVRNNLLDVCVAGAHGLTIAALHFPTKTDILIWAMFIAIIRALLPYANILTHLDA